MGAESEVVLGDSIKSLPKLVGIGDIKAESPFKEVGETQTYLVSASVGTQAFPLT